MTWCYRLRPKVKSAQGRQWLKLTNMWKTSALCFLVLNLSFDESQSLNTGIWDTLKVNIGGENAFEYLPRTVCEAMGAGFKRDSYCSDSKHYVGNRYIKDGDISAMLLFDRQGYIAGIQLGFPKGLPNNYPPSSMTPPFIDDGDKYILTAYFIDPATICYPGRSVEEFQSQGTGTGLYIQTGPNPLKDVMVIPDAESGLAQTKWVKGKCFPEMGMHYWYDFSLNMNCDETFPVFLLYNGGNLNAFGWVLATNLTAPRFEHPADHVLGLFLQEVPTCIEELEVRTTLHIYLNNSVIHENWC